MTTIQTLFAAEPRQFSGPTETELYVIDLERKDPIRRVSTFRYNVLPIAANDDVVYFRLGFQVPGEMATKELLLDPQFGTICAIARVSGDLVWSLKSDEQSYRLQILDPLPSSKLGTGVVNLPYEETISPPQQIVAGQIIVLVMISDRNSVAAVDANTGKICWQQPIDRVQPGRNREWYGPAADAELVVVSNSIMSFGLARSTGNIVWTGPPAKRILMNNKYVFGVVQRNGLKSWRLNRETNKVVESNVGEMENVLFSPLGLRAHRLVGWTSTVILPDDYRVQLKETNFQTSIPTVETIVEEKQSSRRAGRIAACPSVELSGKRYFSQGNGIQCVDFQNGTIGFHIPLPTQCFPVAVNETELFIAINPLSRSESGLKRIDSFDPRNGKFLRNVWTLSHLEIGKSQDANKSENQLQDDLDRGSICNGILAKRYFYVFVRK